MKLTWFGSTALRIHIGGQILVTDPHNAAVGIDQTELVSGADQIVETADASRRDAPLEWQPRKPGRLIDEAAEAPVEVLRLHPRALLVDAVGEPPLILVGEAFDFQARWTRDAVVVCLCRPEILADVAASVLEQLFPKLLVIASPDESTTDEVLERVRPKLDGTGFLALEPGLAIEV